MPANAHDWYASWFDSPYYHRLYAHRDDTEAQRFITRLLEYLDPQSGANMLDVACGKGRHARQLAQGPFFVTGIDLSRQSIAAARQHERSNLSFFEHDMRHLFRTQYFDFIFNFFTSFGYFESDRDHVNALTAIRKGLKADGKFVLDFLNAFRVVQELVTQETIARDGLEFQITRRYDGRHILKTIGFIDQGTTYHFEERVRAFDKAQLVALLQTAGLEVVDALGDYELHPYHPDEADRLILIAQPIAR